VQPGLSRAVVTKEGLPLLAGVETYLLEIRAMKLRIIGGAWSAGKPFPPVLRSK
jgi:hypothetical protein